MTVFQPVAILDELDRPVPRTPRALGQREEVGLSSRVRLAVAKGIDFLGAAAGRARPSERHTRPARIALSISVSFTLLTLTRRGDWKAGD